jgi:flagellar biosynthesis protein FlhG
MIERDIFPTDNPESAEDSGFTRNSKPQPARIVAITSGKGGAGKTNVATNLALALAEFGDQVAILDADFGLANIDVLFGLAPTHHIGHVVFGEKTIEEIAMTGPRGIKIIPASSGAQELADLNSIQRRSLIRSLREYSRDTDWLIIDTAAGISVNVTQMIGMASEAIVVTTPEPTAIVDAYATVKVITAERFNTPTGIIVNKVSSAAEALEVAEQIANVTHQFLGRDIDYLGYVPRDPLVNKAVMRQEPVSLSYPESPASLCFRRIASRIRGEAEPNKTSNVLPFWRNVLGINNSISESKK